MNYFQYGWPTASAKVQNFTLGPDCTAGRLLTPHAYNAIEHVFVFYSCCRRVRDFSVWAVSVWGHFGQTMKSCRNL